MVLQRLSRKVALQGAMVKAKLLESQYPAVEGHTYW